MPSPSGDVLRCTNEKSLRESAIVLNAAEAVGRLGTIFHGAELTLRVRVVIGNVRTAMGLGHSQVGQEESNGLELIEVPRSACRVS